MHRSFRSLILACLALSSGFALANEPDVPQELTQFEPYHGGIIFSGAGAGHWDAKIRERGWILRDGDAWRLWYTGYDGTREGLKRLGLATSADGLNWTRHACNPLSEAWIEDVMVVRHDGRLYMFAEGEHDQIQLLISEDGVHWQPRGRLDIRLTSGLPMPPGPAGTPFVFLREGVWHLFYERRDEGVWLATSKDMGVWTNVADDPVLRPGPGAYDASRIALNQIIEHDGRFYGLYHGTDDQEVPALWTSNIAVSDDLRTWTKYRNNPLFPKSANRSSNILVPMSEGRYRLYTMHDKVEAFRPTKANSRE